MTEYLFRLTHPIMPTFAPTTLSVAALVAITAVFAAVRARKWTNRLRGCKLPPGPPGLPVIGNLLDLSTDRPWAVLSEWSRVYGK